jgi:hypothetical protein
MNAHVGIAARICFIPLAAALGLAACASGEPVAPVAVTAAPSSTTAGAATPSPTAMAQRSAAPTTVPLRSPASPAAAGAARPTWPSGLLPVWPFTTAAQVREWQAAYRSGGHQPWHLDAGATALAFTRGHLGYREIDRVTSRSVRGRDAHIGVGWQVPGRRATTVAVLHLIRVGSGTDAPWVVVGSDDTRLTLDTPRYGSAVTSPLRVGGRITGVDESLRVLVLGPASSTPLFSSRGLPAGGTRTPWSTLVNFRAPHGTVLTIAVSTGGHVKAVEAFAITAVRVR